MWTVGNSSPWHLQETKMEMASRQTWALWNEGISTLVHFHHLRNYGFPCQFTHHHLQHVVSEFNFPLDKTLHSHSALGMLYAPFIFLNNSWDKDKWTEAVQQHKDHCMEKEKDKKVALWIILAWAAKIKHHRLPGLNNKHPFFSQLWNLCVQNEGVS